MLAAWARHESEGDSQTSPFVFEELHYTVRVENVTTRQTRARFFTELLSVADGTKLILIDTPDEMTTRGFSAAFLVKTWKALSLILDTFTSVATLLMLLITEFQG